MNRIHGPASPSARYSHLFFLFVAALSASILLRWILRYGVDFPFFDEWVFLGDFISQYVRGGWSAYDIFASHNEHRVATTRLTYILLYHLTDLDRTSAFLLNWSLGLVILVVWYLILRRVFGSKGGVPLSVALVTSFLTTSPHQFENWTWGFQVQWFEHVLGVLLVVYLLISERVKLLLAFGCAVVTTYTISAGQLIWPLSAFLLLRRVLSHRLRLLSFALWLIGGGLVLFFYRRGLPGDSLSLSPILSSPVDFVGTYLALLGGAVARSSMGMAQMFGFGLLVVVTASCLALLYRTLRNSNIERDHEAGLAALAGFGLVAALLIALARHPLGGAQYVFEASRYTTLITVLWIAGFASLRVLGGTSLPGRLIEWSVCGLIGWGMFTSLGACHRDWGHRRWLLDSARAAVLSSDPTVFRDNPDIAAAAQRIGLFSYDTLQLLYNERLTPFEQISRFNRSVDVSGVCAPRVRGYIDATQAIDGGKQPLVRISGWAFDPEIPWDKTQVYISGDSWVQVIQPALARPDVQSAIHGAPAATGWSFVTTAGQAQGVKVFIGSVNSSGTCLLPKSGPN